MELSERKLKILQAIVADFIHSAEPVGSRTLSKKYEMGISPATIRNEMSDLEEMGFLTHPHTSAGRVPSAKAYRLYVNNMMEHYELPAEERMLIANQLDHNMNELEKTIEHAASLLSEITNLTAFALTPNTNEDQLRYINILPVDEQTVVLMIVAESGKVNNTALRVTEPYTEDQLRILSKVLTHNYKGKPLSDLVTKNVICDLRSDMNSLGKLADDIMPNFLSTLESMLNVDLYMEGLTNIFSIPEYNDIEKARSFLEMFKDKKDFANTLMNRDDGVIVTIGEENADESMQDCSLITASYHINGKLVGKLGVIGPTRMQYDQVTSVIEYITDNLNRSFKLMEGDGDDETE